jgi:hypothetical protein
MTILTEETIVDKVEVVENGTVQVRTANVIKRDGIEINRSFHRHVISPGQDYANEDAKVIAICGAVHTSETIAAYDAIALPWS